VSSAVPPGDPVDALAEHERPALGRLTEGIQARRELGAELPDRISPGDLSPVGGEPAADRLEAAL
jgi:hypothetical protein